MDKQWPSCHQCFCLKSFSKLIPNKHCLEFLSEIGIWPYTRLKIKLRLDGAIVLSQFSGLWVGHAESTPAPRHILLQKSVNETCTLFSFAPLLSMHLFGRCDCHWTRVNVLNERLQGKTRKQSYRLKLE